jgi:hypothetical protein
MSFTGFGLKSREKTPVFNPLADSDSASEAGNN